MDRTPPLTEIGPELVNAIANLDPRVIITLQVKAGDLARAIQEVQGGPAEISPGDAARRFGRSAKYWRAQAESGTIPGAYRDPATERWYLPNAACREHLAVKAGSNRSASRSTVRSVRRGGRGPRGGGMAK